MDRTQHNRIHIITQHKKIQQNTIQHNKTQQNKTQNNTKHHNTIQYLRLITNCPKIIISRAIYRELQEIRITRVAPKQLELQINVTHNKNPQNKLFN